MTLEPSEMEMVAPASPVPAMACVAEEVSPPVEVITGALGAVVSMALRVREAEPVLPAASVWDAATTITSEPEKAAALAV